MKRFTKAVAAAQKKAGGGGYERRQRSTDRALLSSPVKMTISGRSSEMPELKGHRVP